MNRPAQIVPNWLSRDSLDVAPQLLGYQLISHVGNVPTGGTIVEVEAYRGADDPASHAFSGPTPRNEAMFRGAGTIYVYLSYGLHKCVNIVTGQIGDGQAVLIRALEPTTGLEVMAARRNTDNMRLISTGPGRLSEALGITLALSGEKLGPTLEIIPPTDPFAQRAIVASPRVGITKAVAQPWRFSLEGNPFVSRPKI